VTGHLPNDFDSEFVRKHLRFATPIWITFTLVRVEQGKLSQEPAFILETS